MAWKNALRWAANLAFDGWQVHAARRSPDAAQPRGLPRSPHRSCEPCLLGPAGSQRRLARPGERAARSTATRAARCRRPPSPNTPPQSAAAAQSSFR
jgi:hypothetical protein